MQNNRLNGNFFFTWNIANFLFSKHSEVFVNKLDSHFEVHLVWGKPFTFLRDDVSQSKFDQTWNFVHQKWTNGFWKSGLIGFLSEWVCYPVLLRHKHITFEDDEGLNWEKLHNLWSKSFTLQRNGNSMHVLLVDNR